MTTFQIVIAVLGGISTLCGIIVYFVKAYKKLREDNKKAQEDLQCIREGVKCMLRGAILTVYYKHHNEDAITQYEYQNVELQYAAYKALGGNSFIDKVYEDITKWEVIQ